jgi:long-chain acyl-CoA synthetase
VFLDTIRNPVKPRDQLTLADLPFHTLEHFPKPAHVCRSQEQGFQEYSGREFYERTRDLSLALTAMGLAPGDRVAVIAESCPEWGIADLAAISAGAVTVPVYPTQSAEQVRFILDEAGVKFAVVSNDAQVVKVRQAGRDCGGLLAIIVMDGPATPGEPRAITLADAWAEGRSILDRDPQAETRYRQAAEAVDPQALATIVYTSGTTGEPKGVMLTHFNIMSNARDSRAVFPTYDTDVALSFLPLSHVFERIAFYRYLLDGVAVYFAESLTTVVRDLGRVRPTVMTGVPRVYEKFHSAIQEKVSQATGVQKVLLNWALGVGQARSTAVLNGRQPSVAIRLQHPLADRLVFRKIRSRVGGRIRFLVSGSAPLPRKIAEFFHAIGLIIIEGYGLTETSPVLTANPADAPRFGTVGKPIPGVDIRIAPDGEILARGPNVMRGYYKRPEANREVLVDGWFHTGDIGQIDADGYLTITDRKKDLIVTSGGKKIAPQPLENLLKASPLVAEAVLIGEGRKFPAALIVPDFAALDAQARERGWPPEARAEVVKRPEVQALYQELLDRVNESLGQFERIKRFFVLPTEFTMERGELTPTMKVRRKVVETRWKDAIEQMYAATGTWHTIVPDVGL